jgi:hypothetical protein
VTARRPSATTADTTMPDQPDRTFDLDSLWGIDLRPDPA